MPYLDRLYVRTSSGIINFYCPSVLILCSHEHSPFFRHLPYVLSEEHTTRREEADSFRSVRTSSEPCCATLCHEFLWLLTTCTAVVRFLLLHHRAANQSSSDIRKRTTCSILIAFRISDCLWRQFERLARPEFPPSCPLPSIAVF